MNTKPNFYGWNLVGALWVLYFLNMGFPLYGGVVINSIMLKQIPMDRSIYGLGFTLLNFFIGIQAVVIAATILRWGVKVTFAIGSALIFIGTLGMAFIANEPWHYLLFFGVFIGSGISFGTVVPLSTAVTRWFIRYRGRAMAITMTASGVAGIIGAPAMNWIVASNGVKWQQAWLIVAGIAIVAAIIALLFIKESPEEIGQLPDGIAEAAIEEQGNIKDKLVTTYPWTAEEAYRTMAYWMIFIGSIGCQFPFFFFTAHWILHLTGQGISASDAAFAMGLFTMGGIAGRLIGGWLMDKMAARFAFILGICCYFIGSFLAIQVTAANLVFAYIAAILYGAGFGWTFVCLNTITGNFYGRKAFPKLNGTMMLLSGVASCPAGLIGGRIFDLYKNYTLAFELNIVICIMGIIALLFAKMPQPKSIGELKIQPILIIDNFHDKF